jgi:hypothetical protein
MKPDVFSSRSNQDIAAASKPAAANNLNQGEMTFAPAPEAVASRAHGIDEKLGLQPENESKQCLEAGAQLFGGVERESQMHPGTALFVTEH